MSGGISRGHTPSVQNPDCYSINFSNLVHLECVNQVKWQVSLWENENNPCCHKGTYSLLLMK